VEFMCGRYVCIEFMCGVQPISRRLVRYVHVQYTYSRHVCVKFMCGRYVYVEFIVEYNIFHVDLLGMYVWSSCVEVCMCAVHVWSAAYFT